MYRLIMFAQEVLPDEVAENVPEVTAPGVVDWLPSPALIAIGLLVLIVLFILSKVLKGKRQQTPIVSLPSIEIDYQQRQGPESIDADSAALEVFHVPVRLVAVVLAPTGRQEIAADQEEIRGLLNAFIPGFLKIIQKHKPAIITWPGQLSTRGFSHSFFMEAKLPGKQGKATPWCAVAGRFETGEKDALIGLVCCADTANSLDIKVVEKPNQWLDVLRAKV